jgi:hypothetical protein
MVCTHLLFIWFFNLVLWVGFGKHNNLRFQLDG